MRFAALEMLWFLWLLPVMLFFYIWAFGQKKKALRIFGNPELVAKMTAALSHYKQVLRCFIIITAIFFLILAASRPQIGTKMELVKRKGLDIIVVLDTSASMLAQDMKPNRLEKAKHEIGSLFEKFEGDRVGLVVFAGEAFVQCPLTLDYEAMEIFLDSISVNMVPVPGTAIGKAIEVATKSYVAEERKHKVMLLLTDGEDHETEPLKAAEEAAKEGIKIFPIGIGSPEGEPIPMMDSNGQPAGHKKDPKGEIVMSKLDEVSLEKIALATDGKYYRASGGELELDKIYEEISQMEKKELQAKRFAHYEDRYQYLLIPGLICLLIEALISDRRKVKKIWKGRFQ